MAKTGSSSTRNQIYKCVHESIISRHHSDGENAHSFGNDQVHAAGACDVDFKTRVAARSRATLGYLAISFSNSSTAPATAGK